MKEKLRQTIRKLANKDEDKVEKGKIEHIRELVQNLRTHRNLSPKINENDEYFDNDLKKNIMSRELLNNTIDIPNGE